MNRTRTASKIFAIVAVAGAVAAPLSASAQSTLEEESHRRQEKKNQWRNLSIGAGAVGLLGLLKGDKILTIAGLGGSLYSLNRYEQDRKSQSSIDQQRAQLFSRSSITKNGHRYERRLVKKNGKQYYQFVRVS